MTTISYRQVSRTPYGPRLGNGALARIFGIAQTLRAYWQERQASREIESMPLDVRKDLGWPSADIGERDKDMQ